MLYRIGPEALAADMIRKMELVGLTVLNPTEMYYPNDFDADAIGLDRGFNHEIPRLGQVRRIELPVIFVASVSLKIGASLYTARTGGNYWAHGLLLHKHERQHPRGYRQMTGGEALCALAAYQTVRSIQTQVPYPMQRIEVYLDGGNTINWQAAQFGSGQYVGYVPEKTSGISYPLSYVSQ